jgi:hypothetical protein
MSSEILSTVLGNLLNASFFSFISEPKTCHPLSLCVS